MGEAGNGGRGGVLSEDAGGSESRGTVLVALDSSMAAMPVARAASALATLIGSRLEAVHVSEEGTGSLANGAAGAAGISLTRLEGGNVSAQIAEAGSREPVLALVMGARSSPGGRYPAGHVAIEVMSGLGKPVLVVPPEENMSVVEPAKHANRFKAGVGVASPLIAAEGSPLHVLVALDGTEAGKRATDRALGLLSNARVELTAVHVFSSDTLPRFWDQQQHAGVSWSKEFLSRYLQSLPVRLKLRTGSPAGQILEAASDDKAGMIIMGYGLSGSGSKGLTGGFPGDVVNEVLSRSNVPVLLVPELLGS